MNNNDLICLVVKGILNDTIIFEALAKKIDEIFRIYEIPEWLPPSQIRMIDEILLSEDKKTIIERLEKYKSSQLKRKYQKNKWLKENETGIMAIDAFYEIVKGLPSIDIKKKIEEKFDEMELFDYLEEFNNIDYNDFIYPILIRKFDYLFKMKYFIYRHKKGINNV